MQGASLYALLRDMGSRIGGRHLDYNLHKRSPVLAALQRELLTAEGVAFLESGRIDMARFRWLED